MDIFLYSFSFFSLFPNDFNFQMELFPDGLLFLVFLQTYIHNVVALIKNISVSPKPKTFKQDVLQQTQISCIHDRNDRNHQNRKKRLKNPIILT